MGEQQSEKPAADRALNFGMKEISLQYMAKSYAVNVLIMNRLTLIFYQLQKGSLLSDAEIAEVKTTTAELLREKEEAAFADLCRCLEDRADSAAIEGVLHSFGGPRQPS